MSSIIKIKSFSDGEMILSEKYEGSIQKKGRYLRIEYRDDKDFLTKMTLCFDDAGLYRLDSDGERKLAISCEDGRGNAILTLGAHSLDGKITGFKSHIEELPEKYKVRIEYTLSFSSYQKTKTLLEFEAII